MSTATAIGIYLIGLAARTILITAKSLPTFGLQIDLSGIPKDRGALPDAWKSWEREVRVRVLGTLATLGIDTGFAISFDHVPPFPPNVDLAIFAACMGAAGKLPSDWFVSANPEGCKVFVGELGLQGQVRPTRGLLPSLLGYVETRAESDERSFVVPYDCAIEAALVNTGTNVCAIKHVSEMFDLHEHTIARSEYRVPSPVDHIGGELGKLPTRVVREVKEAAIDGKPIHLIGTNADRAVRLLRSILPPLSEREAIESASLLSIPGLLCPNAIWQHSYRAPHHTIAESSMIGDNFPPRPGEVSLAHNGLLCLPDLPQFKRGTIEALSRILREGKVRLVRRGVTVEFPASTRLATTATRCPCERPSVKHSEYCGTLSYRKSDPFRDEFYLGWQTRFCHELGIERIVDTDFGADDLPEKRKLDTIRALVRSTNRTNAGIDTGL